MINGSSFRVIAFVIAWLLVIMVINIKLTRMNDNQKDVAPQIYHTSTLALVPFGPSSAEPVFTSSSMKRGLWMNSVVTQNMNCVITFSHILRKEETVDGQERQIAWPIVNSAVSFIPVGKFSQTNHVRHISYFLDINSTLKGQPPAAGDYTIQRLAVFEQCEDGKIVNPTSEVVHFKITS